MTPLTVAVPDAVWTFITGTSCYQRQFSRGEVIYSDDLAEQAAAIRLEDALHSARLVKRGRGISHVVMTDAAALQVLRVYMDDCHDAVFYGDGASSETSAALKVMERIDAVLDRTTPL